MLFSTKQVDSINGLIGGYLANSSSTGLSEVINLNLMFSMPISMLLVQMKKKINELLEFIKHNNI